MRISRGKSFNWTNPYNTAQKHQLSCHESWVIWGGPRNCQKLVMYARAELSSISIAPQNEAKWRPRPSAGQHPLAQPAYIRRHDRCPHRSVQCSQLKYLRIITNVFLGQPMTSSNSDSIMVWPLSISTIRVTHPVIKYFHRP